MADAPGGVAPSAQLGGGTPPPAAAADARAAGASATSRRRRGLEIATWIVVGLNLLAVPVLGTLGSAAIALQASISNSHGDPVDAQGLAAGYWIGLAVATVVCNGLAVWQRRSWGLGWALLAAVACWAVFLVTVEMAVG